MAQQVPRKRNWHNSNRSHFTKNQHVRNSCISFQDLEEWSKRDANEINKQLISGNIGFEDLLQSKVITGDRIVLIVQMFAKLCHLQGNDDKIKIMNVILTSNFVMKIQKYILDLQLQDNKQRRLNKHFWNNSNTFFDNLVIIFETLLEILPASAYEVLPKTLKAIQASIRNEIVNQIYLSIDIKAKFEKIQGKLLCYQSNFEKHIYKSSTTDEVPIENFRQIGVYPSCEEVLSCKRIYFRKYIIDGGYDNCEHYLDVQFRLLKESSIRSLRDSIKQFGDCKNNLLVVNTYSQVEFVSPRFDNDQTSVLIQVDFKKRSSIRQFIHGSLICFTSDNFNTLLFAKVVNQDSKLLEKGQIIVGLEQGFDNYKLFTPYVMIDSCVNFVGIYNVLKAFQCLSQDNFPLANYIISVSDKIESPSYLDHKSVFTIKKTSVPLFVSRAWPSGNQLNFDDFQYNAFKAALTQCLSIIVGPPGTGKTYLGIKILKSLIINKEQWHKNNGMPLLIICNSDSALDQLLEGLVSFADYIVRIGNSTAKKLQDLNINNKRKRLYNSPTVDHTIMVLANDLHSQLEQMKSWNRVLDMFHNCEGILSFKHFAQIVPNFVGSWFESASDELIIDWLLNEESNEENRCDEGTKKWAQLLKRVADIKIIENGDEFTVYDRLQFGNFRPTYLLSLLQMKAYANDIIAELGRLENDNVAVHQKANLENNLIELEKDIKHLQMCLSNGKMYQLQCDGNCEVIKATDINLTAPHCMTSENRWKLYFYWFDLFKISVINKVAHLQSTYQEKYKRYLDIKDIDDAQILKQMLVIGTTIEDAVKRQNLLQKLQSPVVFVDEATEMLESYLVVSLTSNCQQLILMGDDRKKPIVTYDKTMKNDNVGLSLVERLIHNKLNSHTLKVQHRMQPELYHLLSCAFYPELADSIKQEYIGSPISGMDTCLYFINQDVMNEKISHDNKFIVAFIKYLILNQYQPEDITILSLYPDQLQALLDECSANEALKDVLVTTPENYQGRECKIILLDLVNYSSIRISENENSLCVALSSARDGLYMMGNMEYLCQNSKVWPKIKQALESKQKLGVTIPLCCQVHSNVIHVGSADDIDNVIKNGCDHICGEKLNCEHKCDKKCHLIDRFHTTSVCNQPCIKLLCTNNHKCTKLCHEDCGVCQVLVIQKLPCGHDYSLPCSTNLKEHQRTTPVTCKLSCGHEISNKPCHLDPAVLTCSATCQKLLEAGGDDRTQLLNIQLDGAHKDDDKQVPSCSHMVKTKCSELPSSSKCNRQCTLILECGHTCQKKCNTPCTTDCCSLVEHTKSVDCGHRFKIPCHLVKKDIPGNDYELLRFCLKPCRTKLECGHVCSGTCSKCAQGRIHQSCKMKCQLQLVCGHKCSRLCREPCLPCTNTCRYKCDHGVCKKRCGSPCFKCKQPCSRVCSHIKCSKLCGDVCTVAPCNLPCQKELTCTHKCIGFCGDPCPPLCIVCNYEELSKACFGTEITAETKFVLLEDCKHIIESKIMDNWLEKSEDKIGFKTCLQCKKQIISNQRYKESTTTAINDIMMIEKYFVSGKTKEAQLSDLLCHLDDLYKNLPKLIPVSTSAVKLLRDLKISLDMSRLKKPQLVNKSINTMFTVKVQILDNIMKILQSGKLKQINLTHKVTSYINFLLECLLHRDQYITGQVVSDFKRELRRLGRIIQLAQIEVGNKFATAISTNINASRLHVQINDLTFKAVLYDTNCDANINAMLLNLSKEVNIGFYNVENQLFDIYFMDMTKYQLKKCKNGHYYKNTSNCNHCED